MTALLTDNLPLLAGSPNGIKKLRELILELAVRGKLVPQDPNDEPASELLKRIAEEKAQLVAAEVIRKQKPQPQIAEEEQPFELPAGWAWARLADIAFSQAGFAFKSNGFNQAGLGLPLIRIRDVGQAFSGTYYEGDYRPEFLVRRGDYLISMDGEFRVAAWEGEDSLLNQRVSRLIFFGDEIARRFIADSLQARLLEFQGVKAYTTVDHLSGGQISESVIALPPLAEQHRIATKVDELMALCDRLEARQADAESAHAQLVQALLGSLTKAADAEEFAASWKRLAEHFHPLVTTESSIDALKQTLLQLAVMGKLVPQDPSDETVNELLKRVELGKQAAFVGRNKVDKLRSSDANDEKPFTIPSQWSWARLGELAISGPSNGYSPKPASVETPYRCLTLSATTRGVFNNQCFKFVDIDNATASKYFLKEGDFLIQRANSIDYVGVSAIYDGADDQFIFPDLIMRIKISDCLNKSFIHYYLSSIAGRAYFRKHATGTQGNMPKINQGTVVNAPVPIPPLAEQHRIVAKVDQLTAICDQLKNRLTQARRLNEQLATALVEQAVA